MSVLIHSFSLIDFAADGTGSVEQTPDKDKMKYLDLDV